MKFLICIVTILALASASASKEDMELRSSNKLRVSSPLGGAMQQKKAQGDKIKLQDSKIKTIEEEIQTLELKRGPPGPPGATGSRGPRGERGENGRNGLNGLHGRDGRNGLAGLDGKQGEPGVPGKPGAAGEPGQEGKPGASGERGATGKPGAAGKPGAEGPKGLPGTGLTLKKFVTGAKYVPGDYVFSRSSKGDYDSMFIAEKYFVGRKPPAFDMGNWEEFRAPQGEKGSVGAPGEPGREGPRGPTGHRGVQGRKGEHGDSGRPGRNGIHGRDGRNGVPGVEGKQGVAGHEGPQGPAGTGLTLKTFAIGTKYYKGDYVFSRSTSSDHNSMFIAENDFEAKKLPSEDLRNWEEFQAPKGEKGDTGAPGKDGKDGETGATGAAGGGSSTPGDDDDDDEISDEIKNPSPPEKDGDFEFNDFQIYIVGVKGLMISKNILKACHAEGLVPVCNSNSYADGRCAITHGAWHISYKPHYNSRPVPAEKLKGVYSYCGSGNNQFSLQDTGGSHRWSSSSDRNGKTLCTTPMSGHMINWKDYRFVRVAVKGQMTSYNIAKACKKAKLEPLCDHSSYSDGKCLVAGANWHFSVPASNRQHGVPVEFMQGSYLYCSNANGDKSLLNTGTTHRWTTHNDRNGDTICARELKSFNQDFVFHEHKVKRVEVKGKMTSYNIAKACQAEGLRPLCDHNSYMDGTCVLLNDAWHFSHPSHVVKQSELEQSKLLGAFFYCGSSNGGKSLENVGNTHAWTTSRDRNGETYCTKARAGETSEWEEYHFERVAVKGKMNSYNINKACTAAKMRPLCDHGSYFDGKCLLAGENWHFSVPGTIKSKGIDADFFRGAYLYCGSASSGKSLLNTGTSHRWSLEKDKNGDTICARMKKDFNPDFEYQGFQIKRVTVKGDMGSENILKTCKAKDLMPVCDHSSYINGRCVMIGENWHFSHPSHIKARSGLDQRKMLGTYVYSGNGNGGKTLKNVGNTHAWSSSNDRNGQTLCTTPKDGEKLKWNGLKLQRVRVNGPMTSPSILAACKAAKMTPVCDHPNYADGKCIKPSGYTSHMSVPGTNRQFGLRTEFTKGVYFYCGKANHQKSLLNTGTSHRWSVAHDYGGETICAQ